MKRNCLTWTENYVKIGEQWRREMTELTLRYHNKLKHEQSRNKKLRAHLKYLQVKKLLEGYSLGKVLRTTNLLRKSLSTMSKLMRISIIIN